jgi:hypothetical protein
VSTQETLQQQLACQVDAAHTKDSTQQQQLDSMASQLQELQKQLADAHAAVAAMAEEAKAAEATKASLTAQLGSSQAAVSDRDAALDALADELVSVSGTCDEQTAAREQAEEQVRVGCIEAVRQHGWQGVAEAGLAGWCALGCACYSTSHDAPGCLVHLQTHLHASTTPDVTHACLACLLADVGTMQVVALATELEESLLQLSSREQLLEQIWSQLVDDSSASLPAGDRLPPKGAIAAALSRTEQLHRLRQQQKQRWVLEQRPQGAQGMATGKAALQEPGSDVQGQQQQQRTTVAGLARRLSNTTDVSAAGIAHQAVQAAMRRSSQCSDGTGGGSKTTRLQQHQQQWTSQQQQQQQGLQTRQQKQHQQQEVQGAMLEAVRCLKEQVQGEKGVVGLTLLSIADTHSHALQDRST